MVLRQVVRYLATVPPVARDLVDKEGFSLIAKQVRAPATTASMTSPAPATFPSPNTHDHDHGHNHGRKRSRNAASDETCFVRLWRTFLRESAAIRTGHVSPKSASASACSKTAA